MRYIITFLFAILFVLPGFSQSDRRHIRNGNRLYRMEKFDKAEVEYRKAVSDNSNNPQARYNLGCALMAQKKDSAAISQYEQAGKLETSPRRKAMVYHNIGVVCQQHQLYQQAISAYEESLRNNPHDNETRYNLALCKRQQKQQKNQDKQNKNQNKKNQKNKDNKNQQNKQNQDKQSQKNQQNQPKDQQMSKENAEQLLNAAIQQEQATQQRLKDAMRQPRRKQLQKNW